MVESFDPHEPFDCPEKYHQMYNDNYVGREFCWPTYAEVTEPAEAVEHLEKCYLGTLSMADYWFGRLLETLKRIICMKIRLLFFDRPWAYAGRTWFYRKNIMHAYNEMAHIPLTIHFPDAKRIREKGKGADTEYRILCLQFCSIMDVKYRNG